MVKKKAAAKKVAAPARRSTAARSGFSGEGQAKTKPAVGENLPMGKDAIKVRATRLGYYGDERKRVGDVFLIGGSRDFSDEWMETVDGSTPVKTTGPQAALNRETHRIAKEKAGAEGVQGQGSDEASAHGGTSPLGD